jgi:lysine-specific demethylase/histidyl-hydroxylase NO66
VSAAPLRFEDFVGDPEVFFAKHAGQDPLLRRGAVAGRLPELPSVADLDDLLVLEAAPPWCLRVTKDGRGVPSQVYTRDTGRGARRTQAISAAAVGRLFRDGATITWDSVNHILPSARRLAAPFARAYAARAEVLAFMTPAGHDGFPPHCDSIEVFVVQVHGTKAWTVWGTPESRDGREVIYRTRDLGEPTLRVTLCPGDVLYLPYGTPHTASAQDALSLHLSVGVEPCRWRDLLRDTVATLLELDAFAGIAPPPSEAPGDVAELASKLSILQSMLAALDPATELTRLAAAAEL